MNIDMVKPSTKTLLHHIEIFEQFCTGEQRFIPSKYREINQELSVSAVWMLGKRRIVNDNNGEQRLLWKGLDNREHDLGPTHNANIMRDYPGFHAKRSLSLGHDFVENSEVVDCPKGCGPLSVVTLKDGTKGVGPNYRIALRNASLKMHLSAKFNYFSLSDLWNKVWGTA